MNELEHYKKIIDNFYTGNKDYLFLELWKMIEKNKMFFSHIFMEVFVKECNKNIKDFYIYISSSGIFVRRHFEINNVHNIKRLSVYELFNLKTIINNYIYEYLNKIVKSFEKQVLVSFLKEKDKIEVIIKNHVYYLTIMQKIDLQKLKKIIKDNFYYIFWEIVSASFTEYNGKEKVFDVLKNLKHFKTYFADYIFKVIKHKNHNIFQSVPQSMLKAYQCYKKIKKYCNTIRSHEDILIKNIKQIIVENEK